MDDDDGDEADGNQKGDSSILEEGYDADQEEGDSDGSDEKEEKLAKSKKQPKQRKRSEYSKQQISKGLVIYPQICNILLQVLKVYYGSKLCDGDSDWYALGVYMYALAICFIVTK